MKNLFIEEYETYLNHMRTIVPDYDSSIGHENRRKQCLSLINAVDEDFNFNKIITLETGSSSRYSDGLFGLFLGFVTQRTNGKMISVDISESANNNSKNIFGDVIPDLEYKAYTSDSLSFLNKLDEIPNLVHLDSWDLNLFDPLPCALHGWEEFKLIESKMEKGSIIIIDDNYRKDTYVQWIFSNGEKTGMVIPYPMIGKGAHVYQEVLKEDSKWKLIGNHYDTFDSLKIIIQKK